MCVQLFYHLHGAHRPTYREEAAVVPQCCSRASEAANCVGRGGMDGMEWDIYLLMGNCGGWEMER